MPEFYAVEWNALVNRARATLNALRTCTTEGGTGDICCECALAGAQSHCGQRFRATERRLNQLIRRVPKTRQMQLRRTVDGLELIYRELREGGESNA
jgi:hypothetical protein